LQIRDVSYEETAQHGLWTAKTSFGMAAQIKVARSLTPPQHNEVEEAEWRREGVFFANSLGGFPFQTQNIAYSTSLLAHYGVITS
jgi:hypothetical protein